MAAKRAYVENTDHSYRVVYLGLDDSKKIEKELKVLEELRKRYVSPHVLMSHVYVRTATRIEYVQEWNRPIPEDEWKSIETDPAEFYSQCVAGLKSLWAMNFTHNNVCRASIVTGCKSGRYIYKIANLSVAADELAVHMQTHPVPEMRMFAELSDKERKVNIDRRRIVDIYGLICAVRLNDPNMSSPIDSVNEVRSRILIHVLPTQRLHASVLGQYMKKFKTPGAVFEPLGLKSEQDLYLMELLFVRSVAYRSDFGKKQDIDKINVYTRAKAGSNTPDLYDEAMRTEKQDKSAPSAQDLDVIVEKMISGGHPFPDEPNQVDEVLQMLEALNMRSCADGAGASSSVYVPPVSAVPALDEVQQRFGYPVGAALAVPVAAAAVPASFAYPPVGAALAVPAASARTAKQIVDEAAGGPLPDLPDVPLDWEPSQDFFFTSSQGSGLGLPELSQ